MALTVTRGLLTTQRARPSGRGRRPSPRAVEQLTRRQGLADASYAPALAALRDLAAAKRPRRAMGPADLLARLERDA